MQDKLHMSLDAIAAQTRPAGGRTRKGRPVKNSGDDVDMEAGGSPHRRPFNQRRDNNRQQGGKRSFNNSQGTPKVLVVHSMEEARRIAARGGGQIINAQGQQMRGGGRGGRSRQDDDVFRNFSNDRRGRRHDKNDGVLVRIDGLDKQVMVKELSALVQTEFKDDFVKAFLDFDETERSLGSGGLYFRNWDAAEQAINFFNTKRLDGRPMNLFFPETGRPQGHQGNQNRRPHDTRGERLFRGKRENREERW